MFDKLKPKLIYTGIAVSVISLLTGCGLFLAELSNYPFYYVEKPCVSDKVVVESASYTLPYILGTNNECLSGLGSDIHNKANQKCSLFTKTQNVQERCKAYRGNWNSSENVEFGLASTSLSSSSETSLAHSSNVFIFTITCKIKNPVTFTCN